MKLIYTNIQSIYNKLDELKLLIHEQSPDIIVLTETWLSDDISNAEVAIGGYHIYRKDRMSGRKGGGLLLYLKDELSGSMYNPAITSSSETLWVSMQLPKSCKLFIGVVYRPPTQDATTDDELINELRLLCQKKSVIIIGDFNAPGIDWDSLHVHSPIQSFESKLVNFSLDEFLYQAVKCNTRFRHGQNPSCLDLIFSKDEEIISETQTMAPIGLSDHCVLNCIITHSPKQDFIPSSRRNIWKADIPAILSDLQQIDWDFTTTEDLEQSWGQFKQHFLSLVSKHCPMKRTTTRPKPGWLNSTLKREMKKKKRAWKLASLTGLESHQLQYKRIRNEVQRNIKRSRIEFDLLTLQNADRNPKQFYAHINSKLKSRDHIPILRNPLGHDMAEDYAKAEILSSFFKSVFVSEVNHDDNEIAYRTDLKLDTIMFSEEDVERELAKLVPGKSPGPDEVNPRMLKIFARDFAKPLSNIFKQTLTQGCIPNDWKTAVISPIYKGGPKHSPNSYRPISLTCVCCKILERIIKSRITSFLENNCLLTDCQHGFRANRSCLTNLLLSFESWSKALDSRHAVDIIYIDFRKAFDSVPHKRLLYKLQTYGIDGQLLKWLESFITGRTQRVCLNGTLSTSEYVLSGVPQGSVLGPLLFLIYVNDIPDNISCNILMFADDVKIWNPLNSPDSQEILQRNIDALHNWSEQWLLRFNVDKCAALRLCTSTTSEIPFYSVADQPLNVVTSEKDLGILVDSTLKPNKQCTKAANTALSIMRRIRRAFPIITPEIFHKIYPTFIRSHLEYAIQVWRPWLRKDIVLLENVQRRSTKIVQGLRNLDHVRRQESLNIFPLEYRQNRGDLILAFKILRGINCCLKQDDFFTLSANNNLRGHQWKLNKERSNLLLRSASFSQRVVNMWNALPASIVSSTSVDLFKRRLDEYVYPTLLT
jgi:hypothetical protein